MDPMTEIDQELSAAMRVDTSADFAARVRTRIAAEAPADGWQVSWRALAVIASAAAVAVAVNILPSSLDRTVALSLLHQDLTVMSTLPIAVQPVSAVIRSPAPRQSPPVSRVLISRSEMLALQRLFSGATVLPPAPEPAPDELSIPALAIDLIPLPAVSTGDEQ